MTDATLVYDDDCGFCTRCAEYLDDRSTVEIVGFSELDADLRERLPEDYEECSHLVTEDAVYSCGESIERAFLRSEIGEDYRPVVEFLRSFEEYERLRERGYELVADNRSFWSDLSSLVFGDDRRRDR
ncbi:MAG: DCC1-like thiol-disulfide oxidoreductase family protein [Halorientalis sp.]